MGASLVCMVCNLTMGNPKYAAYHDVMSNALGRAERLRAAALDLADEDARAFDAVMAAYRLPRATAAQQAARVEAVQQATVAAADVSLRTAEVAVEIIRLAEEIVVGANQNVVSDVAVAALSACTALQGSAINVEVNLKSVADSGRRRALAEKLEEQRAAVPRADSVVRAVRARIVA
jgi:formiminotetrahydrofolate cyclodeaminase